MRTPEGKIIDQLKLQRTWAYMRHILADYVLYPVQTLLFEQVALYPNIIGHFVYSQVYKQSKDRTHPEVQENANRRIAIMSKAWNVLFPERLVECCYLRLMGTQRDMVTYRRRVNEYAALFLYLIGEGNANRSFVNITCDYFAMLQDYLLRNCPDLPEDASELSISELLKTVRLSYARNSSMCGYVPFEQNIYPSGILQLLDELADTWKDNPVCRYPLITPEYIFGLFLYVYMIEFIIHANNQLATDPIKKKVKRYNLIGHLRTLHLEENLEIVTGEDAR